MLMSLFKMIRFVSLQIQKNPGWTLEKGAVRGDNRSSDLFDRRSKRAMESFNVVITEIYAIIRNAVSLLKTLRKVTMCSF